MGVNKVVFGAVSIMDISDSTVTPDTLAAGKVAYGKDGERITGTLVPVADPELQSKTVTPTTSTQTVKPDSGYDGLSQVTVNAMPTATQATPSISVSSSGLITASATQSAGYVPAGTKSATKQLTTQAAKTVTPTTSSQTAVASGRYTTGAVTVEGDANLKAENIKSGVSIFGVSGSYEGSGGSGGGSVETCTVTIYRDYYATVYYTEAADDGSLSAITLNGGVETATCVIPRNSIMTFLVAGGDGIVRVRSGNATVMYMDFMGDYTTHLCIVKCEDENVELLCGPIPPG